MRAPTGDEQRLEWMGRSRAAGLVNGQRRPSAGPRKTRGSPTSQALLRGSITSFFSASPFQDFTNLSGQQPKILNLPPPGKRLLKKNEKAGLTSACRQSDFRFEEFLATAYLFVNHGFA